MTIPLLDLFYAQQWNETHPDTVTQSGAVVLPQTVRMTGFSPSPPLVNGGEGRPLVCLVNK